MTSLLIKKRMREFATGIVMDSRKGVRRSKTGIALMVFLYIFIFFSVAMAFVGIGHLVAASTVEPPMDSFGLQWLYFSLMAMMTLVVGVFGGIFTTYSTIYHAKDNEFLFSLPIPTKDILNARLFSVALLGLVFQAAVFLPSGIVFDTIAGFSFKLLLFRLVVFLVLGVAALALSCLLGWVVALIAAKVNNKSFLTTLITLVCLGAYYWFYFNVNKNIQALVDKAISMSENISGSLNPFYLLGNACLGDGKSLLYLVALAIIVFILIYVILSRSFLRICTTNKGAKKAVYKGTKAVSSSADSALLRKEFKHLTSSPAYMLNCALGVLVMIFAAVMVLIKGSQLRDLTDMLAAEAPALKGYITAFFAVIIAFMTSMNDLTAPSISLEGASLWILQSLPVQPKKIFRAKLKMHLILTYIPLVILAAAVQIVMQFAAADFAVILVFNLAIVFFSAEMGLVLNVKIHNLTWSNETVAVKQGINTLLGIMGCWVILLAAGAIYYFLLGELITPMNFIIILTVILAAGAVIMDRWLCTKGSKELATM